MRQAPTKLVAGSLIAALASATVVPAAVAATNSEPPRAQSAGLLDGLNGLLDNVLGSVLGNSGQLQLQNLLGLLGGGQAPTAAALDPLQQLLDQIAATPGLPAPSRDLIQRISALLDADQVGSLSEGLLAPVASLLHGLADTDGVPAPAANLLDQVANLLGSGTAGLPGVDLSGLDLDLVSGLTDVVDALTSGGPVTGTALAPVLPLLDQVANAPGLPTQFKDLINQVGDTIESTTGALDPIVSETLATLLALLGNTPSVPGPIRTVVVRVPSGAAQQTPAPATAAGGNGARAATSKDRARIVAVRVNKKHTRVIARIVCPRSAPQACATTSKASFAGRAATAAKRSKLPRGVRRTVKLTLKRSASTAATRHGGKLRFTLTTKFGSKSFKAQRTMRVAQTSGRR